MGAVDERQPIGEESLPPLLTTSEADSFAAGTITDRKPRILRQVCEDDDYPPEIADAVAALETELADGSIQPLTEQAADVTEWNQAWAAWQGRTWRDVGWYFAEAFLYRRLLEAIRYLQPGPWQGQDPFWRRKRAQERSAMREFALGWGRVAVAEPHVAFEALLHSALWGNRADLSNIGVRAPALGGLDVQGERHRLLVDDTERVSTLCQAGLGSVAIVTDNVGLELLSDLALADFLMAQSWAQRVTMHVKDRPFYVSDALQHDVALAVAALAASDEPDVRALGARLRGYWRTQRLRWQTHPFWTGPMCFRSMPSELRATLAEADLVVLKGDLNYRRLVDDRRWPYTTLLAEAAGDFPRPFLALRTLKAELVVGLSLGQAEQAAAEDPDWLVDGERGLIQLVE